MLNYRDVLLHVLVQLEITGTGVIRIPDQVAMVIAMGEAQIVLDDGTTLSASARCVRPTRGIT